LVGVGVKVGVGVVVDVFVGVGVLVFIGVGVGVGVFVGVWVGAQGIVNVTMLLGCVCPVAHVTAASLVMVRQPGYVLESTKAIPRVTHAPPPERPTGKTA
jgi:hypothetical protein